MSVLREIPAGSSLLVQGPANARIIGDGAPALSSGTTVGTPVLSSISPSTSAKGLPALTMTATGTGFSPSCVINVDGADRKTTFISATSISAVMDGSALTSATTNTVLVKNGALSSGTKTFSWT